MTPNPRYSPLGSGYIIELSVACYFAHGGGAGFCVKSKQCVMPSAAASRAFSVFKPKIVSQNLTRLTCDCSVFEMYPAIIAPRKSGGVQTGRHSAIQPPFVRVVAVVRGRIWPMRHGGAVCAGKSSELVVEGVIFFKQDDNVLDWTYWWHPHLNDKS
jgi:hypothetical protein